MKVKFTCIDCQESFVVQLSYLKDKTSLSCPNCAGMFPGVILEYLSRAAGFFLMAKDGLSKGKEVGGIEHCWGLSIVSDNPTV